MGYFLVVDQGNQKVGGNYEPEAEDSAIALMEKLSPEEMSASVRLAVEGFLNAETLEERCQFIHGGERHLEMMEKFYAGAEERQERGRFVEVSFERMESVEGVPFIYLNALDDQGETHVFNLMSSGERMLIDWESSVCYGEMTWGEFQEKKPEEGVLMRVLLSPRDSEDDEGTPLDFVLLAERDDRSRRIVYVDPEGEVSAALGELFKSGAKYYPYTLYLRWNAERRVAEVVGLKHLYWIDTKFYGGELSAEE
ncbi:MAG: hypothetical protein ACSHYF_15055 [Verrucomicrobiaceae bacterium]